MSWEIDMKLNQKGITLVELLAALTLVALIAAGAWTVLSIGLKHSAVEINKTVMQQDANLIISKLTSTHQKSDMYKIKFENEQLMFAACTISSPTLTTCKPYERIVEQDYNYTSTTINGSIFTKGTPFSEITIKPKKHHTKLDLVIRTGKSTITINTSLTRILTNLK